MDFKSSRLDFKYLKRSIVVSFVTTIGDTRMPLTWRAWTQTVFAAALTVPGGMSALLARAAFAYQIRKDLIKFPERFV
jgi:hypothetical protein